MAQLPTYKDLEEKRAFFSNRENANFIINTKAELDKWFDDFKEEEEEESNIDATAFIYRGMKEAKHKLLTSSQRLWISTEMEQWTNKTYIDFVSDLVNHAKVDPLIKKVFDLYNYSETDREFPILSLLQHYGAPTPLMDWTYNENVAFFFAIDGLCNKEEQQNNIDNYFSIYRINKRIYKNELLNIIDFIPQERYPEIKAFKDFGDKNENPNSNGIFYISDFEQKRNLTGKTKSLDRLIIRTQKPLTSTYNHNIIPQAGLFIFNPFSKKTLEDIFNPNLQKGGWNLRLTPFDCFNIHKDLSEYLKRKIDIRFQITKSFIYPDLNNEAKRIKEKTLNDLISYQ